MSAENLRIVLRQERDDKLALEQLNAHLYMQLQLAPKHLAQQSARELASVQAELRAAAVVADPHLLQWVPHLVRRPRQVCKLLYS